MENEYLGEVFAVGEVRSISGYQAIRGDYQISPDTNSKWRNVLVLLAMAFGYRLLVHVLLTLWPKQERIRSFIALS